MCTKQECIEKLQSNFPYIRKTYGVNGLCVFGSVARGDNKQDSDVDILVDMPPKVLLLSSLKDYLESLLGCPVDLIRRHARLSSRFLNEVSRDLIEIH